MPTFDLKSLALISRKTLWKCHGDFTCQRMGDVRSICLLPEILYGGSPLSYTISAVDADTSTDKRCGKPREHYQCRCCCWRRRRRRYRSHHLNRIGDMLLHQEEKATWIRPEHPSTDKPADDFHLALRWYRCGIRPYSRYTKCYK